MTKKTGYRAIGFTENLIREEIEEEARKSAKEIDEQDIRDLQRLEIQKKIELLDKVNQIPEGQDILLPSDAIVDSSLLKWKCFSLDVDTGKAMIAGKFHQFNLHKPIYKYYLLLLKKRIKGADDGEVTFEEFVPYVGEKQKEEIKQMFRNLRKNLGINTKVNPQEEVFQATGRGYKLVIPLKI